MTFERLYRYQTIVREIDVIKTRPLPEALTAIDTTRPGVRTSSISDPTATVAEQRLYIRAELERLEAEKAAIEKFISDIDDEFIHAIAFDKFILGMSYRAIAREFYTNRNRVSQLLRDYIESCAYPCN